MLLWMSGGKCGKWMREINKETKLTGVELRILGKPVFRGLMVIYIVMLTAEWESFFPPLYSDVSGIQKIDAIKTHKKMKC